MEGIRYHKKKSVHPAPGEKWRLKNLETENRIIAGRR